MIADEIRARVKDREYREIFGRAEWVQVPFPVYPYLHDEDCLDWHEDRVPAALIPRVPGREGVLAIDRLPFETTGFFHPGESGVVLAIEARGKTEADIRLIIHQAFRTAMPHVRNHEWEITQVDGALLAHMIGLMSAGHEAGLMLQTFIYLILRVDPTSERGDPYASRALWPVMAPVVFDSEDPTALKFGMTLIHAINTASTLRLNGYPSSASQVLRDHLRNPGLLDRLLAGRGATIQQIRDHWWLDTGHTSLTISTASALLNARNLTQEIVTPTHCRGARRRGDPAPYRYHVLKIDPARARGRSESSGESGAHTALHLRRGHWKVYTPEAPLLGKHIGRWWWHQHLAGQADRLVDKDYEITAGPA
jgi:hypothetical protein